MNWSKVPEYVRIICETIEKNGGKAYPVGGCVRDVLLGRVPQDWDITTSLLPESIQAIFPNTVPTGIQHGTVTVLMDETPFELTTFRTESDYTDGRRPDHVSFCSDVTEDLARRDFTINAMALASNGEIIDPFGGRTDLTAKVVRCVGNPETRFSEDGLRLLRCIRFSAQLGFEIEEKTLNALEVCKDNLSHVAGERVKIEIEKILLSANPNAVELAVELGMLNRFGVDAQAKVDLNHIALNKLDRWTGFCQQSGLDITLLPVERTLRRGVLHPEIRLLEALPVTAQDLIALGYEGKAISETRKKLLEFYLKNQQKSTKEQLLCHLRNSCV